MDLEVRKQYNIIKPFVLNNLPDLVIITGENGSGKTQLLNFIAMSVGAPIYDEIEIPMCPDPDISNETGKFIPPLIISDKNKRLTTIEYQPAQTPRIELGKNFNVNTIVDQGNELVPKFFYSILYKEDILNNKVDIGKLETGYLNYLHFKKSSSDYHNREITYPHFTQNELNSIKNIYDKHGEANPYLIPYYYIAYLPVPNYSTFAANLKFLYLQYWARKKAKLDLGIAPWESFNNVAETAGFRYLLEPPKLEEDKFDVLLRDKDTGTILDADFLSSGEKEILSLILAMYTSSSSHHPDIILLDEPDAFLHPSLSCKMLDVIQNVLIKDYGIKVIMTTHSPSTVAIAPEESIYTINRDRGVLEKDSKDRAIQILTAGISSLSIYYEKLFQVFVEADNDNRFLSQIFTIGCDKGILDPEKHLNFVNLDQKKSGGCSRVTQVVNMLRSAGNPFVYGVIDWDGKNSGNDRILVLGGGTRYALDNYILDPLAVSFLFLMESEEKLKIGFSQNDSIVSVKEKTAAEWQQIIDSILVKVYEHMPEIEETSEELVEYKILEGKTFYLPKWFICNKGHKIREAYQTAFPFLKKYSDEKALYNKIINACYLNYCEFIPTDVINTLKRIQNGL